MRLSGYKKFRSIGSTTTQVGVTGNYCTNGLTSQTQMTSPQTKEQELFNAFALYPVQTGSNCITIIVQSTLSPRRPKLSLSFCPAAGVPTPETEDVEPSAGVESSLPRPLPVLLPSPSTKEACPSFGLAADSEQRRLSVTSYM